MHSRKARLLLAAAAAGALTALAPFSRADDADRRAARVELGRRLYFEPAVSRRGTVSCASCHDPEHGFSDARRFSPDETGTSTRRTMSLIDSGGTPVHLDGGHDTLRQANDARLLAPPPE